MRPPSEPKPFVLVPIPSDEPKKGKVTTFEKFEGLCGQMELEFEVVSEYLFVGSGGYDFDPNAKGNQPDVWHTFYRRNRQICVPGTSLKGSIRAILEAISNSCVSQARRNERISPSHRRCEFKSVESQLCPACRIFGTTGLKGSVSFSDALPIGNAAQTIVKIAELWEPRRQEDARRFYEVKAFQELDLRPERNHRFVEAVPKGTKFQTVFSFENLTEGELGLLFHSLGWKSKEGFSIAFNPKLGGAKPRCFGAIEFKPKSLKLWKFSNWQSLLSPEAREGETLTKFIQNCLNACQRSGLLHEPSWRQFVENMQLKSDACPRGNY